MTDVLILGAGLVAPPVTRYFADKRISFTIAANDPRANTLADAAGDLATAVIWDAADTDRLIQMVEQHQLVISLLPATMHVPVARACIDAKRHLITASYVSAEMSALDAEARTAGVLLLNEIGLDPGIDHMSAMEVIDSVHRAGGKLTGFSSYCGGIPAPDANTNPWGYKFSWSPRGALAANRNAASFLKDGSKTSVPGEQLSSTLETLTFDELGPLEAYANRDATEYLTHYGLQGIGTMYRGTLRYPGWCEAINLLRTLDLFAETPFGSDNWRDYVAGQLGCERSAEAIAEAWRGRGADDKAVEALRFLGIFEYAPVDATIPRIDALANVMQHKLAYGHGERDMVVMRHVFEVSLADKRERITATMIAFGDTQGDSAMAQTVGYPVAIAASLVLSKKISHVGVQIPVDAGIYQPILAELKLLGISLQETREEI